MSKDYFSKEKLTEILELFTGPVEEISTELIVTGHINNTYKITYSGPEGGNTVLLQNLNTYVFKVPEAVMHNIVRCAATLKTKVEAYPFEILEPFQTLESGQPFFREGRNAWRVFNFIENTKSLNRVTTGEEAEEIGYAFGTFLSGINRDDPSKYEVTIPDFHDFTKRYKGFSEFLDTIDEGKLDERTRQLIAELHNSAPRYLELEKMEFPRRLAHHDTKANNVLLDGKSGKTRAVIDLDTLMPGDIFSDFGDLIRTALNPFEEDQFPASRKSVDTDLYSHLATAFFEPLRQLWTEKEKKYMIPGGKKIILLQVLRFLEDHIKGDVYYQVGYRGHNLDRAFSQMNLYRAVEAARLEIPSVSS